MSATEETNGAWSETAGSAAAAAAETFTATFTMEDVTDYAFTGSVGQAATSTAGAVSWALSLTDGEGDVIFGNSVAYFDPTGELNPRHLHIRV